MDGHPSYGGLCQPGLRSPRRQLAVICAQSSVAEFPITSMLKKSYLFPARQAWADYANRSRHFQRTLCTGQSYDTTEVRLHRRFAGQVVLTLFQFLSSVQPFGNIERGTSTELIVNYRKYLPQFSSSGQLTAIQLKSVSDDDFKRVV